MPRSLLTSIIATAAGVPAVADANPLAVYGEPTYSQSAGGYLRRDLSTGLYPSIHVNDAGTAVATGSRYSSAGSWQGHRAFERVQLNNRTVAAPVI